MSSNIKFYFRPSEGEQTETTIHIDRDERCSLLGKLLDVRDMPVSDAVVLLFKSGENSEHTFIARCISDEDGHFILGPLDKDTLYLVKIFKNSLKIREIEIKA